MLVVDTEEVPLPDVVVAVEVDVPPEDELDPGAGVLEAEPESEVARGTMSSTPRRRCVKGMAAWIGIEQQLSGSVGRVRYREPGGAADGRI